LKKIKIRTTDFLFLVVVFLSLVACREDVHQHKNWVESTTPADTIFVATDSSQRILLNSLIEVYEALNPLRKVIPIFDREKRLYRYLQTDKVDVLFRTYIFTAKEKKEIEIRKLNPKIHPLWSDGLALIAAKTFPIDSLSEKDLIAVLTGRSKAFEVVVDNSNTAAYDLLYDKYFIDKGQMNAYAAGNEEAVIQSVKKKSNYVGVIGSAYFTVEQQSLPKGIKLLGLVPKNGRKAEYPFQDQLYNGVYPLARQIYGINVGALAGSGSAFVSFVLSERGQRIILKAGLLPAKIPSRTIELISE
jgi:phosphate transport system substrate-binding protein